jgi:hypothetical protein
VVLEGGSRQLDSRLPTTFGGSRGQHDVFTFYGETWTDARRRDMYMAGDRLLETLMNSPAVRSLVQRRHDELLAVSLGISAIAPNSPAADVIVDQGAGVATKTRSYR